VKKGVKNLWKGGESAGLKPHPNYNQYIQVNYFKAFMHAFPFMWSNEMYWYLPKNRVPWDMFLPFVLQYNKQRTNLLNVIMLILDESMSGWRPKSSATGGLPNITYEPRKPVNLGTMVRNGAECITGIFVHHDIVQSVLEQGDKKYVDEVSHLPEGEKVQVHVAEVLRQVENAKVPVNGWVGGDAWFGSINTVVELKRRVEVNSTFIVKQNKKYFPMEVLRTLLLLRFPRRPAGHWVIMKATISEVDVFVMAYAWSNRGITFIVSSCGETIRHEIDYRSKFDDGHGNVQSKFLARPAIAHMLFEFLPLIDEHNKARQSHLALERRWQTTSCWFRLSTTFIGMAIVDLQRWDRNMRAGKTEEAADTGLATDGEENEREVQDSNFDILEMADLIAKKLTKQRLTFRDAPQQVRRTTRVDREDLFDRYKKNGSFTNINGKAFQRYCYICRLYGETHNTQWMCKECFMPLCQVARRKKERACMNEHKSDNDRHNGCGWPRELFIAPKENLKYRELTSRAAAGRDENARRRDKVPKKRKLDNAVGGRAKKPKL